MSAVGRVHTRKASGINASTPPAGSSSASSTRPTQRFRKVTQEIIARASRAESRCHVRPLLESKADGCNSVASTDRWPTHDGNGRFPCRSSSTTSGANGVSAASSMRSARRSLDPKFLQAAVSLKTDHQQRSNNPSHKVDHSPASRTITRAPSQSTRIRAAAPEKSMARQNTNVSNNPSHTVDHSPASQTATRALSHTTRIRAAAPEKSLARQNTNVRMQTRDRPATTKHKSPFNDQLCKDCKTSIRESICFISNDGKITAALTGSMHDRSLHYCSKPGCAAYRPNQRSKSAFSKKPPPSKKQVLLNQRQSTAVQPQSHAEIELDRLSVCSSVASSFSMHKFGHDAIESGSRDQSNEEVCTTPGDGGEFKHQIDGGIGMDSVSGAPHHQNTVHQQFSPRDGDVLDDLFQNEALESQSQPQPSEEHVLLVDSRDPADVSCDTHDPRENGATAAANTDAVNELHHFKPLCYQGDNEYSCSEDGTDATNTPNSLVIGAFGNASSLDAALDADQEADKTSQERRSSVARMRRRYLESLAEQEAERVRLRKQEMMARKQAGDWMLDGHMEELLHRLAPNGEARVKVLVEAFEQVLHYSDSEGSQAYNQEHNQTCDDEESIHNEQSS